jgi:hypothetical protein
VSGPRFRSHWGGGCGARCPAAPSRARPPRSAAACAGWAPWAASPRPGPAAARGRRSRAAGGERVIGSWATRQLATSLAGAPRQLPWAGGWRCRQLPPADRQAAAHQQDGAAWGARDGRSRATHLQQVLEAPRPAARPADRDLHLVLLVPLRPVAAQAQRGGTGTHGEELEDQTTAAAVHCCFEVGDLRRGGAPARVACRGAARSAVGSDRLQRSLCSRRRQPRAPAAARAAPRSRAAGLRGIRPSCCGGAGARRAP